MRTAGGCQRIGLRGPILACVFVFAFVAFAALPVSMAGGSPSVSSQPQTSNKRSAPSAETSRGSQLFLRDCAHCHGKTGDGNSPVRATLHPQPLDLTNFQVSEAYVLHVLHNGVPGTDMPAWHASREEDLRAEAQYTAHLAQPDELSEQNLYAPPEALTEAGKRVFEAHCVRCHGAEGDGNGPDARRYSPKPPSFAGMRPSFHGAQNVIQNGVPGTSMPAWTLLTPPEIQAVTYYVQSFYNGGAARRSVTAKPGARP